MRASRNALSLATASDVFDSQIESENAYVQEDPGDLRAGAVKDAPAQEFEASANDQALQEPAWTCRTPFLHADMQR